MAIDHRVAYCQVCDGDTRQWKPSHRTLWSCDSCNTNNLDESGRYNCLNSLEQCVSCDTFLSCLGRLDEKLLEKVTRFREARERLEKQDLFVLDSPGDRGRIPGWRKLDAEEVTGKERETDEREKGAGEATGKDFETDERERGAGNEGNEITRKTGEPRKEEDQV